MPHVDKENVIWTFIIIEKKKIFFELFKLIVLKRFGNYDKPFGFSKCKVTLIF